MHSGRVGGRDGGFSDLQCNWIPSIHPATAHPTAYTKQMQFDAVRAFSANINKSETTDCSFQSYNLIKH
jgi:hypothetical protein